MNQDIAFMIMIIITKMEEKLQSYYTSSGPQILAKIEKIKWCQQQITVPSKIN